jgi:bifunctional non-homologous end joining protein LigD
MAARGIPARAARLPGARKALLPSAAFPPQLASLHDDPPAGDEWLHELKWDGYRLVATVVGGKARLWSRNGIDWTGKVPHIARAIEKLGVETVALDGELIAGAGKQQDYTLLKATLSKASKASLVLVLFDILHLDGVQIDQSPLVDRKALLKELLKSPTPGLAYSAHIEGNGAAAFELAEEQGYEGIISKRAGAPYRYVRSDDWWKVKARHSDEFAVVGFTKSTSNPTGFGSLLLAKPDETVEEGWRFAGRVGTGFSGREARELRKRMDEHAQASPTVAIADAKAKELRELKEARWFAPLFVVEVNLRGTTGSGLLRQASFKGLRLDKRVEDLE